MSYHTIFAADPKRPPEEFPPDQTPIPDREDPTRPSIPEELPPTPMPDPSPSDNPPLEMGGRNGPEPTRYGDWEHNGKCVDF